jgi:hypothetical protein
VIWLANHLGQDRVEPMNLSIMEHMMTDFVGKSEDAVLILDGIEFLLSENEIKEVLMMLYSVMDEVIIRNALLLLPIDPNVLDASELALFEREFDVVPTKGSDYQIRERPDSL